ncbi:MAG: hypothetical protein ACE5EF_06265 [Dehalococcoidia bacterium]
MAEKKADQDRESAAARLGRRAGRLRRKVRESRPDIEGAIESAVQAATPAAGKAAQFVREHQDELKRAGATGARALARRAAPPVIRPVLSAIEDELGHAGSNDDPDGERGGPENPEGSGQTGQSPR